MNECGLGRTGQSVFRKRASLFYRCFWIHNKVYEKSRNRRTIANGDRQKQRQRHCKWQRKFFFFCSSPKITTRHCLCSIFRDYRNYRRPDIGCWWLSIDKIAWEEGNQSEIEGYLSIFERNNGLSQIILFGQIKERQGRRKVSFIFNVKGQI